MLVLSACVAAEACIGLTHTVDKSFERGGAYYAQMQPAVRITTEDMTCTSLIMALYDI
jgi:hypothetical protein